MERLLHQKLHQFLLANKKSLLVKLKEQILGLYNMQLILLENIISTGKIGDKVVVANGYEETFF